MLCIVYVSRMNMQKSIKTRIVSWNLLCCMKKFAGHEIVGNCCNDRRFVGLSGEL